MVLLGDILLAEKTQGTPDDIEALLKEKLTTDSLHPVSAAMSATNNKYEPCFTRAKTRDLKKVPGIVPHSSPL